MSSLLEAREGTLLVQYQLSLSSPQNHTVVPSSQWSTRPTLASSPDPPLPPLPHLLPELQPLGAQTHQAQTCLRAFALAVLSAQNELP